MGGPPGAVLLDTGAARSAGVILFLAARLLGLCQLGLLCARGLYCDPIEVHPARRGATVQGALVPTAPPSALRAVSLSDRVQSGAVTAIHLSGSGARRTVLPGVAGEVSLVGGWWRRGRHCSVTGRVRLKTV